MSRKEKLIFKLLTVPKDFTYEETKTLLNNLGYIENNKGKSSGSRVAFIHENKRIIILHKPHPEKTLKEYVIKYLIDTLKDNGDIL